MTKIINNVLIYIYNQVSKPYEDLEFHIELKHLLNVFRRNNKFDCEKVDFQKTFFQNVLTFFLTLVFFLVTFF